MMKKHIALFWLAALMLTACGEETAELTRPDIPESVYPALVAAETAEIPYESRFDSETVILLSDEGITAEGEGVYTSRDIIYYEEKTAYDSGNPYGEGTESDMHSAGEAEAHLVVNITKPGAYRISGRLSAGQIRVDLGEDACCDETAVVELILDNADITCTVAPALLFMNVYECDGSWSADTAKAEVDTSAAGANLILEGKNTVSGSYVARIYKDKEGEKKLWKQDGAVYSYMSMNVYGPGSLDLYAENEGLDTELHLTVNGGNIAIRSGNDGINTNEDGVSVTTVNAGTLHIIAGLGEEGDGVDSNGYLVINGGTVIASANPAADAGLDSDLGSYINGGTVVALGSAMDWAESDSRQVTMNLQFADFQSSGAAIVAAQENGTVAFAYDPGEDEVLGENIRRYQGAIVSCPNLVRGCSYLVYTGGKVTGTEIGGIYDVTGDISHTGGTQMMYTGTDVTMRGPGGGMMGNMEPGQRPEGEKGGFGGERPEGFNGEMPKEWNGERPEPPDGAEIPGGFEPDGMGPMEMPGEAGEGNTRFYMQDMVNFFSGLTKAE